MRDENSWFGKAIGNYRLVREVNSGSFGTVYQGKHIIFEDDPLVAIKVLHTPFRFQREHEQFIKEAQVLKKLNHPNILRILDAGFHARIPYIVTEYAAGGSLRDCLERQAGRPLLLAEALTLLAQIADALHVAHQQGIVHCDLKPENILFTTQGAAVLADFGVAVILATKHTQEVGRGGTPAYMAPELFEGTVSMKSDQYALGCIAYELLTGRPPFQVEGMSLETAWYHHAKVDPLAPRQLNPQLPAHIEQALLKALAKQRDQRYDDIAAFVQALQTCPDPDQARQRLDKGAALSDLQRYEEALAAYEQAIKLNPSYADAYYGKGDALFILKRYEEALAAYEQAIKLNPSYADAYYGKSNALFILKRYEEALAAYEQAIKLDPTHADANHNNDRTLRCLQRYLTFYYNFGEKR